MALPLLRVENLSKSFDRLPVLKDVSFSMERGEILGLVGRQGAGRSTVYHLFSGAILPTSGTIYFDGAIRHYSNRMQAQKLGVEIVYPSSGPINRLDVSNTPLH